MSDNYSVKKITELTAKTSADDSDIYVLGNAGSATMRRITFANLASAIKEKLKTLTVSTLNTSNKTLPGAINELNSNLTDAVQIINYTAEYTLAAGASTLLSTTNFGITAVSGYTPIGPARFNSGSADVAVRSVFGDTVNGGVFGLRNVSSSSVTATATLRLIFVRNAFL